MILIVLLVQKTVYITPKLLVTSCTSPFRKHLKQSYLVIYICCVYVLTCNHSLPYADHWEVLQQNPGALSSNETLSDIWSGAYLRQLSGEGRYFSNCDNLAISTDGVPLFKSSNISLWPVYFTILNLPPAIHMNAESVLMAGLWYGKKPPMKHLLSPIMESLSLAPSE